MQQEIIISGFGGQGALFGGQLLAHAAMESGYHVTWIPSYGPEMRGGKARCTVVVSDEEIGSPLTSRPTAAIVMNLPSMEAFESAIRPGGVLIVNSSLIPQHCERADIRALHVQGTDTATELGSIKLANVVLLGALAQATGVVSVESLGRALTNHLPERHRKLLDLNLSALKAGAAMAASQE